MKCKLNLVNCYDITSHFGEDIKLNALFEINGLVPCLANLSALLLKQVLNVELWEGTMPLVVRVT
jgi:hypothetical protein